MEATLHVPLAASPARSSAARRYGLLGVALAAALLGLTTLDVGSTSGKSPRLAQAERSTECIVASALFAGVAAGRAP